MTDRYQKFAASGAGRFLVPKLGLPDPAKLRRYRPGQPVVAGPVLLGSAPGGRLDAALTKTLSAVDATVHTEPSEAPDARYHALVFDATGITSSAELRHLFDFFHPTIRRVAASGRVIVLGTPPEDTSGRQTRTAQRALEGFVRSVGKELKRGATAHLVYVAPGAEEATDSTVRFLLSAKSAYVDAQVIRIGSGTVGAAPEDKPLEGKVALVTGASRGIGESIAQVLARDGAHVVCLDVPAMGDALSAVANAIGGTALQLDITRDDAPGTLAEHLRERHGGVDIVVHNAGIIRDKTLGRMKPELWDAVLAVNLTAQERITEGLLGVLRPGGRIVSLSSIAGIAGNVGQTNYATSKAGVIGFVQSWAPELATRDVTINAIAPGFIETQMTASVPLFIREAGRRMNSLSQGGLPVDIAETVAWFAHPGSGGVTGNVVRVCGQSLLGA
ncbi:3-oxoacyl-ACP reductase [Longispora fulva]|uniref:3-oxoacyl-[acyl-carrier protein] reductase n=1 Tax=Longispora fulva TaxID=619741 RepID=A0A8J7GJV1_9ACTN|nr:3-oxoacyl-ACP reductase [Longispora fulva]MBG6141723.1 3-oxoacyl-[acyl-carrier protein] reductase [Longispora fulva]GIG59122.1 3-oxoacyl-ACP reductase [Longispora fulva]